MAPGPGARPYCPVPNLRDDVHKGLSLRLRYDGQAGERDTREERQAIILYRVQLDRTDEERQVPRVRPLPVPVPLMWRDCREKWDE